LRYLGGDPPITLVCSAQRAHRRELVEAVHPDHAGSARPAQSGLRARGDHAAQTPARLTIDVDGAVIRSGATVAWAVRRFDRHHRQKSQLLSVAGAVGADGEYPAAEESTGQRARLQAGRGLSARAHRRPARLTRPSGVLGLSHGRRRLLPARGVPAAYRPGLWLRDQGRFCIGCRSKNWRRP
jgi:hypothetical protein